MRSRLAEARVGHLATVDRAGDPHVVPCCFALDGGSLYTAVDAKPKRTAALKRLDNVRHRPRAAVVVDHYEDDWAGLWWVRVSGPARILEHGSERERALAALAAKYEPYAREPPVGPVIAVDLRTWRGWP